MVQVKVNFFDLDLKATDQGEDGTDWNISLVSDIGIRLG